MFPTIALWCVIILIVIWAVMDPISRVCKAVWELLLPIFKFKSVDFKKEFGDWAGTKTQQ